jgi:hypothetical protein
LASFHSNRSVIVEYGISVVNPLDPRLGDGGEAVE